LCTAQIRRFHIVGKSVRKLHARDLGKGQLFVEGSTFLFVLKYEAALFRLLADSTAVIGSV
jgi:hypothetical protein